MDGIAEKGQEGKKRKKQQLTTRIRVIHLEVGLQLSIRLEIPCLVCGIFVDDVRDTVLEFT